MQNIIFIDKPKGITSYDVIRRLKGSQITGGERKLGHAGTLDPLATGLLIIGVGAGTKKLSQYADLPKEYEVEIEFGKISTTYDADGEIKSTGALHEVEREDFEKTLNAFTGEIKQMPPAFSAKRIHGKRAYDIARSGGMVKLEHVLLRIFSIEIIDWNWPLVQLRVKCAKGTYIRSLAHDIGQTLGCGGYVKELRRTGIGEFRAEDAIKL